MRLNCTLKRYVCTGSLKQLLVCGQSVLVSKLSLCSEPRLTHVDSEGKARMVDITGKSPSNRFAEATGCVYLPPTVFQLVSKNLHKKGDVLTVAEVAGVMGGKKTADLIPLCHSIASEVTSLRVECRLSPETQAVLVTGRVKSRGATGVEMEALTAVSIACLTIYDIGKAGLSASERNQLVIQEIRLKVKEGGRSGTYLFDEN